MFIDKKGTAANCEEKKKWNITRFPTLIFLNEKGDCIIDKQVLNTITESEILNYWNEIIYKLLEGKIERIGSDKTGIGGGLENAGTLKAIEGTPPPPEL